MSGSAQGVVEYILQPTLKGSGSRALRVEGIGLRGGIMEKKLETIGIIGIKGLGFRASGFRV